MSTAESAPIGETEQLQILYGDSIREIVLDPYVRSLMESKILGHEVPGDGETTESLAVTHIEEICNDRKTGLPPAEAIMYALEVCEISVKKEGIIRGEA